MSEVRVGNVVATVRVGTNTATVRLQTGSGAYDPSDRLVIRSSDTVNRLALDRIDDLFANGVGSAVFQGSALRTYRAAMATRSTTPVNVVGIGDSLMSGWEASTIYTGYFSTMADRVCQGVGQPYGHARYLPCAKSWNTATQYVYGNQWTHSGSSYVVNEQFGIGRMGTYMPATGSNYAEVARYCDRITLAYPTYTALVGTLKVYIDTVLVASLNQVGASVRSTNVWDSGALTPGTHTLKVESSVLPCNVEGAYFHSGDYSSGVRFWNGGKPSSSTYHFMQEVGGVAWCDGFADNVVPSLVIIELGSNDVGWAWGGATTQEYLENTVDLINANTTTDPSILFVVAPRNSLGSLDDDGWNDYVRRPIYRAAQQYPTQCAVFDAFSLLGQDATAASPFYSDSVHFNQAGHTLLGEMLGQYLLEAAGVTPTTIDGGSA